MIASKFEKNGFYKINNNIMSNCSWYARQLKGLKIQRLLVLSWILTG
jgi:hypothetical protein